MGYNHHISLLLLLLSITVLVSNYSYAATIHGTIYDLSLEQMSNVRVVIDTQPKQFYIAKNGTYELNLPLGNYSITAYTEDGIAYETLNVVDSAGDYVIDFVLSPQIDNPQLDLLDNISTSFKEPTYTYKNTTDVNTNNYTVFYIVPFAILFLVILYAFIISRNKDKRESREIALSHDTQTKSMTMQDHKLDNTIIKDPQTQNQVTTQINSSQDPYVNKVLLMIKKEKRITQRDLRKDIPLSEGKISLIISELEHEGNIKKIKKGRGNILVFIKE